MKADDNDNHVDADSSEGTDQSSVDNSEEHSHVGNSSGSWQRFAQTRFQFKASHSYCCAALPQPLMPKRDKADHLASLASWITILRIMGDLPEADYGDSFNVTGVGTYTFSQ